MGYLGRMKSFLGGSTLSGFPLTAASTINLPSDSNSFNVTGTATVTGILAAPETRGRQVQFYVVSGVLTLTNSPGTTTAGQMDLGSLDPSNVVLSATDSIDLMLRTDGTWVLVEPATNL